MNNDSTTKLPYTRAEIETIIECLEHDDPLDDGSDLQKRWCAILDKYGWHDKNSIGFAADMLRQLLATEQSNRAKCAVTIDGVECERDEMSLVHERYDGTRVGLDCHPFSADNPCAPTVQAQPEDALAPVLPNLAAYETLRAKGKAVQESGGWHDQKAFKKWNFLITETHRALCQALAQIVGERVMNAVLCIEANGWSVVTHGDGDEFESHMLGAACSKCNPTIQAKREQDAKTRFLLAWYKLEAAQEIDLTEDEIDSLVEALRG